MHAIKTPARIHSSTRVVQKVAVTSAEDVTPLSDHSYAGTFGFVSLATHILFPAVSPNQDTIVLLHGFTQNSGCWGPFAEMLAIETGCEIVAIDAPGHGATPAQHDNVDLWDAARLIAEAGGSAHYVGYSMGGRMGLHVALEHPQLVRSLTLIGATPGIEDPGERGSRKASDAKLAERLLSMGLETFLNEWLAQPLFAGLSDAVAHRQERMQNRASGLAASLQHCGTGSQDNLWPRLQELATPLGVVVGSDDAKFFGIAKTMTERLAEGVVANVTSIDGARHSVHLEQPLRTANAVGAAINQVGTRG
jgi:2-succinyl-6-hydroxy-2,4-cyclohexadiene-1-carboxylate synthase